MKIYVLIAVASACFLITSCTTDDSEPKQITNLNDNNYMLKDSDTIPVSSTSIDGEPVKTNGKDD